MAFTAAYPRCCASPNWLPTCDPCLEIELCLCHQKRHRQRTAAVSRQLQSILLGNLASAWANMKSGSTQTRTGSVLQGGRTSLLRGARPARAGSTSTSEGKDASGDCSCTSLWGFGPGQDIHVGRSPSGSCRAAGERVASRGVVFFCRSRHMGVYIGAGAPTASGGPTSTPFRRRMLLLTLQPYWPRAESPQVSGGRVQQKRPRSTACRQRSVVGGACGPGVLDCARPADGGAVDNLSC